MAWWNPFSGGSQTSKSGGNQEIDVPKNPVFLEDVPPKYQEDAMLSAEDARRREQARMPPTNEAYSTSKEVNRYIHTLTWDDFRFSNLIQIPCFREAGLSGFSCMFVFGTVLFVYHRDLRKCFNWGYGGLLLGSVFGWEHCNRTRRHSEKVVEMAQQRYQEKLKRRKEEEEGSK